LRRLHRRDRQSLERDLHEQRVAFAEYLEEIRNINRLERNRAALMARLRHLRRLRRDRRWRAGRFPRTGLPLGMRATARRLREVEEELRERRRASAALADVGRRLHRTLEEVRQQHLEEAAPRAQVEEIARELLLVEEKLDFFCPLA
jgi:hypothetical protein